MKVKVEDYGITEDEMHYVTYRASDLDEKSLNYLNNNLEGDTILENGDLIMNIYYSKKFFPFGSDDAKFNLDDFIKREEIEMFYFLIGFLEDMK
ncbi:MAG: hypothetical protein MJ232_06445 [archaeon]|nr:hypothetical protein [archaeon]